MGFGNCSKCSKDLTLDEYNLCSHTNKGNGGLCFVCVGQLQAENEQLKRLLKYAVCPDSNCCNGSIPHQVAEGEWEAEQCQWCYERDQALKGDE